MADAPTIKRRKLTDYTPDPRNANAGTERGQYMIDASVESVGAGRSLVSTADGVIAAGNKTLQALVDAGIVDVIEVETDGKTAVVVKRSDWSGIEDDQARRYAYLDNRAGEVGLAWDAETVLADLDAGVDLSAMFRDDEIAALLAELALPPTDESDAEMEDFAAQGVPDAIFPSDNEWGVPTLIESMQANFLDAPVLKWGVRARTEKHSGTYHFYTDDYKFEALWDNPDPVVMSGCPTVIEPNFSTNVQMPRAVVLWGIFKKRWLARYWQECGVRVFVDLNIETAFADIALLGVPRGWKAYSVRGVDADTEFLDRSWELAKTHRESDDLLFVVVGGGAKSEAWAQERGAIYLPEYIQVAEGRKSAPDVMLGSADNG